MKNARAIAVASLILSLGFHAGGVMLTQPPAQELNAAASAEGLIKMGNSFEDIAGGVTTPNVPETQETPPPEAEVAPSVEAAESTEAVVAESTDEATVDETAEAEAAPSEATEPTEAVPSEAAAAVPVAPTPPASPTQGSSGAGGATAVRGQEIGAVEVGDLYGGNGNSETAAIIDSEATAQYGNAVLAALTETTKERTPTRGTAKVVFVVGDQGDLRLVEISESSGSETLDEIAMNHIRRSAPFPPPPHGARRRFVIAFEGRS